MVALRELFFTDVGLLSLAVILIVIFMGGWFSYFFAKKMAESQPPAAEQPGRPQA